MKTNTFILGALLFLFTQLAATAQSIQLTLVTDDLTLPTDVANAGDGSGRLFILEKAGTVQVWNGSELSTFLDITSQVYSLDNETGLLGIAFHPDFETNGYFYLNYTTMIDGQLTTRISGFQVPDGSTTADVSSQTILLEFAQPFSNHNGGALVFGDDGYLYIATGDGGGGGDPLGNAQSLDTYLGKILRIDVDGGTPYSIPADNPFVDTEGALDEIYAYGLRNPWRVSKDRATGEIWIADVGQGAREEVNILEAGANYGWNIMEGTTCYNASTCDMTGLTMPVYDYERSGGNCSVTGGYVYRGSSGTFTQGNYIFSDYCSGQIWSLNNEGSEASVELVYSSNLTVSSFGEDENGELYIADFNAGDLYLIEPVVTSLTGAAQVNASLHIYPNPASESFTIELPQTETADVIELYDAQGRLVKNMHEISSSSTLLDIADVQPGLYTVKVVYQSGKSVSTLAIIQ